jgi:LysR family glycine cleavage system transcriptional activator
MTFETVARRLSFALAAGELHLTPSAVSHQIAKLEDLLGTRLFERQPSGIVLTGPGKAYLDRVAGALGAIGAATDDVRSGVRNTLYVHSTPSFASLWLMPKIADFAQAHPSVSLSMSSSPTHSDFGIGQVDLDIRYGVPNWPQLVVEPIFDERILPLANPAFIERHRIESPEDLLHVPLIQSTVSVVQWPDWFDARDVVAPVPRFAYRFDRAYMALDAAVQGLGVALESSSIGAGHIAEGRLRPIFDASWALPVQAHFLVYPARHRERREVANFIAWLKRRARGA